jgi:histone H3/H4
MCPKAPDKADTADGEPRHFRVCSSCRRPLEFESRYYTCSVSTCNRAKTALTFCSLPCFEAHVPVLRHREAWAEEQIAPSRSQFLAERERDQQQQNDPGRLEGAAQNRSAGVVTPSSSVQRQAATGTGKPAASKELPMSEEVTKEVLVVISKVKSYIRAKSSMNTSDAVTEALSELVRTTCDQAIEKAKSEGRKTVMARDITGGAGTPE